MNKFVTDLLKKLEDGISRKDVRHYRSGKSFSSAKNRLNEGIIMINPLSTTVTPVTTGATDEDGFTVEIILAKNMQSKQYKSASKEAAAEYLMRVMEGRDRGGGLSTNTIRYVVRTNFRNLGLNQEDISIEYDTEDVANLGAATATMTLTQIDHTSQLIN